MHESHLIFLMCFKIANTGQAFYIAWYMCKKCLSPRIWILISCFFWTSDTFHLSLVTLDHISPQKQTRMQQDRLSLLLPRDFKERSLRHHSWGAKSPCQPPEHLSEIANAKWRPRTVTKALRFSLLFAPPLSYVGLAYKPAKTMGARNSTAS